MKKLCSFTLVLCMLLALVVIPTSAEPAQNKQIAFDEAQTTYTDAEGVEYTILRTKADFLSIENGKNYIFANDINLDMTVNGAGSSAFGSGATPWYQGILDGNGYAIYGFAVTGGNNSGLFFFQNTAATVTFKNLSFGTEAAPFNFVMTGNGSCGAVTGKTGAGSSFTMINCDVWIKYTGAKAGQASYFGQTQGAVSYYFENCTANGSLVGANKTGGFCSIIDKNGCSATFINCVNNVNITGGTTQGVGGFVGQNSKSDTVFRFENCVNNGNITGTDGGVSGFIGYTMVSNLTFVNCQNKGTLTATNTSVGDFVGTYTGTTITINVQNPVSLTIDKACGSGDCDLNLSLTTNIDGTASAGWQKTAADENGKVKVRLLVAVSDDYLDDVTDMTLTGVFGLTAGGTKTLTLGKEKIKYYSSVVAAGETVTAAEGYVLLAVVVENIPEADWNGSVGIQLTAAGSENVVAFYHYDSAVA